MLPVNNFNSGAHGILQQIILIECIDQAKFYIWDTRPTEMAFLSNPPKILGCPPLSKKASLQSTFIFSNGFYETFHFHELGSLLQIFLCRREKGRLW